MEKIIGILGGMGPLATVDLFSKIIHCTAAAKDQDHIRIIIDNNPKIPDRTAAILGEGEDPLPLMRQTAVNLERAGADFILFPCNTAHYWYDDLQRSVDVPVMHMIEEVARHIQQLGLHKVGLLATTGTLKTRLYHRFLDPFQIHIILPDHTAQTELVMEAIYMIKAMGKHGNEATSKLLSAARDLISHGAQGIIAGCTEIPLVLFQNDLSVPLIEPVSVLAQAAVKAARVSG